MTDKSLSTKPLGVRLHLTAEQMRKLITVTKPEYSHTGCAFCLSSDDVRLVESYTGESLMVCRLCLDELASRQL